MITLKMSIANQTDLHGSIWGNLCVLLLLFFLKIYLFIFGCVGSRFCARAFSSCGEWGLLFIAGRGLLIAMASLIVVASLVMEHRLYLRRLSSCGSRA